MNILFLSTWFPYPLDNGSKLRVYHLLRALGQTHRVTLLSLAFGAAQPDEAARTLPFCAQVYALRRNPFERSRLARSLRFLSPTPIVNQPLPEMVDRLRAVLAHERFDVAIASTKGMAAYLAYLPPGVVRIVEEHNSLSRQMWERYRQEPAGIRRWRSWASWQKTRFYEAGVYRRVALCTMVSEEDRRATLTMLPGYRGRVELVPNGVDCQHNRPGLVAAVPHSLIFNGSLTYSANYDAMRFFLAKVYPLLRQQIPAVSLTITGSTDGVSLAGLPLDETVRLTGHVDDVRDPVARAQVCVIPIRRGGGTRLKILEAMALGVPVVSTAKGAEGLEVRSGEHLLIADEPVEFAQATVRLLQEPRLCEHLIGNARRLVEQRYDWDSIGQRFVALVEAACVQTR